MPASGEPGRLLISNLRPQVDGGRYPVKRIVGEWLTVSAQVLTHGPETVSVFLVFRHESEERWSSAEMRQVSNDVFGASFLCQVPGRYFYTVEAWVDRFGAWALDLRQKVHAGRRVGQELMDGAGLVREAALRAEGVDRERLEAIARRMAAATDEYSRVLVALDPELEELVAQHPDRAHATSHHQELVAVVERPLARCGAWYQMFPRSVGAEGTRGGTLRDAVGRLDDIRRMGFDVVLLSPIHPVGRTNRKGRDGALVAASGDPGSPWAIGNEYGGHKTVDPALGTLEDFDFLVAEANRRGLEVAMEFATNCSPDHPWVKSNPQWFRRRGNGTFLPVENHPFRFEDLVAIDFDCADWRNLWAAWLDVVLFWCGRGVRAFRVDHPHGKPIPFWEWLVAAVRERHPDVVLLAEAFTRPAVMDALSKSGFSQSLTYFTWRNTREELVAFMAEVSAPERQQFFRPNLFCNTPDVLAEYLQAGGRPAFMVRALLAATLSPSWGIYSGYELAESDAIAGTEQYAHSEKFEYRPRDYGAAGNIRDFIGRLNRIRREHKSLRMPGSLEFHPTTEEDVLFYTRATEDGDDLLLVVVNLHPTEKRGAWIKVPIEALDVAESTLYQAHDLISEVRYVWQGQYAYVEMDPWLCPGHVFVIRRRVLSERNFDYYQ